MLGKAHKLRMFALSIGILPTAGTNWKAPTKKALKDKAHSNYFNSPKKELKIKRDFDNIVNIRTAFGTSVSPDREIGGSFENSINGKIGFIPVAIGGERRIVRKKGHKTKHFHTHPSRHKLSRRPSKADKGTLRRMLKRTQQPIQETIVSLTNTKAGIGAVQIKYYFKKDPLGPLGPHSKKIKTKVIEYSPFALEMHNLRGHPKDKRNPGQHINMIGTFTKNQKIYQNMLVKKYTDGQKRKNADGELVRTRSIPPKTAVKICSMIQEFYLNG